MTHWLLPDHTFSAYLEDTSPAEIGNQTGEVAIQVRDPAGLSRKFVFGPDLYIKVREFQNVTTKARLSVPASVEVPERYLIVIMVNDDAAVDASDSYFELDMAVLRRAFA